MQQALKGIKIASFAWVAAGPLTVRYLALHGAIVVRVESHARVDLLRTMHPYKDNKPNIDGAAWFAQLNTSTYSLSLDLNKPKGREIAWKLIMWADLVTESFGIGLMKRWGLDYETVSHTRPDIVYFSTTQLGETGPHAYFIGGGWMSAGIAGFTHFTGWPDRPPVVYHGAYTDFVVPRFAAAAILAALDYRRRTGKGQFIDVSQLEGSLPIIAPVIMDAIVNKRAMNRSGNSLSCAAPHGVYPCQGEDRWIALAVFAEHWEIFCNAIGSPDWCRSPQFYTLQARKENEEELNKLVGEWTKTRSAEVVETLMQSVGIPCSVVKNTKDLFEDPQLKHRGFMRVLKHPVIGEMSYRRPSFKLSETPDYQFVGPTLGQHNEYVCKELLGMSDEEIAEALIEGGITTDADLPQMSSTG